MRTKSTYVFVALTTALLVGLCTVFATGQAKGPSSRATERTISDALRTADQATIDPGFVVTLYTTNEVKTAMAKVADRNRRFTQYTRKRELLEKKMRLLLEGLEPGSEPALRAALSQFFRYDRDDSGALEGNEFTSVFRKRDSNKDGKVSKAELARYFLNTMLPGRKSLSDLKLSEIVSRRVKSIAARANFGPNMMMRPNLPSHRPTIAS